jgi:hypothetical protein
LDITRRGGRINYIFYNKNNYTAPMIMLDVKKQYTNLVSWLDSMSGRIVIIGDPDEDDDSDGVTMPVTTAVWNENGYYDLSVDYNMSIAVTNGKPDWAVQVNY